MKIEGTIVPKIRVITGLYSFDRSFINRQGDIGYVLGTATEFYGKTHCGKSTIMYSLAGMIANHLQGNITLLDLEGFDAKFFETVAGNTGFDNTVYLIQEETDEKALKKLAWFLSSDHNVSVGILDSVGAISPIGETEGDIGDRNMGQRAFAMAQFSRKYTSLLRTDAGKYKTIFMSNHSYPNIGTRGSTTPGGEVKNFLATIRIVVSRRFYKGKYEEYPDGSYVIKGQIAKNRWGLKGEEFLLFVLSGYGIHKGLTAMIDCLNMGLAKQNRTINVGKNSFGYMKAIVEEAHNGNEEFFSPFYELLANAENKEQTEKSTVTDLGNGYGEINDTDSETELEDNQQD